MELADVDAVNPETHVLVQEYLDQLGDEVRGVLQALPERVRATAMLLTSGKTQEEIAAAVGVSSRMVRNYKRDLERALGSLTRA